MIEKKIKDIIITYDPFYPQLINNYLFFNSGYVSLKKKNVEFKLHEYIDLVGGDLLGYRLFHCFRVIGVFARGTNTIYLINTSNLKLIKKYKIIELNEIPLKIILDRNGYYLKYNKNKISLNYNETQDILFFLYIYRFYLLFIILLFINLFLWL